MSETLSSNSLLKQVEAQELAAKEFGFYWERLDQLIEQIKSECSEIEEAYQANDPVHLQEEIGDLLQAAICLSIFCHFDPSITLENSIKKFQARYDCLVQLAQNEGHHNLQKQSTEILLNYWKRAKKLTSSNLP